MLKKRLRILILAFSIFTTNFFVSKNFVQAVTVKKQYINNNRSYETVRPIGIVIHDTDEPGGTAQNNRDYINRDSNAKASAHYFVDWNNIIQTLPENEVAWHAGYTANHKYLSIEMCVPYGQDAQRFNSVYKNTIELAASICKKYSWNSSNIYSHKWVSQTYGETDHTDPIGYLNQYGKTWNDMINDIEKEINHTNSSSGSNNTIPTQSLDGSISALKTILNKNGYGNLIVDNTLNSSTINSCPLLKNGSNGEIVKWVQKKLGISVDGIFGNITKQAVISFQKSNGLGADGIIGKMTWAKLLNFTNQSDENISSSSSSGTSTQNVAGNIAELQTILNNNGYGKLIVDSVVGQATIAACPLLKNGSSGEVVKWVQKKLGISVDGVFGQGTKRAVEKFQSTNGLEADGEIGKMTWRKLLGV